MTDPPASSKTPSSGRRLGGARLTRLLIAAAVLIYGVIFIALNRGRVKIHFVFFTVTSRLWVGFLVCVALGVLLGQIVGVYRRKRSAKSDRSQPSGGTP